MNNLHNPSHRQLVHRFIDWDLIENRLLSFSSIKQEFELETLKKYWNDPPYYCHYMAWRLGTWRDEKLFSRLDKLFSKAQSLPNWEEERSLIKSKEFAEFWSLVWQLQVAEYLDKIGADVQWAKSGPDLSVILNGKKWYVECYVPRKSFGLLEFITELLQQIDNDIRIYYDTCIRFRLPRDKNLNVFLDTVFESLSKQDYIDSRKKDAESGWPVVLYKDNNQSNYPIVYIKSDKGRYIPGIIPNKAGDPITYLKVVLQEAINAKAGENALSNSRPNIVAVNYLLSTDFQMAYHIRNIGEILPDLKFDHEIDAIAFSKVGFHEILKKESLEFVYGTHPSLCMFGDMSLVI